MFRAYSVAPAHGVILAYARAEALVPHSPIRGN